MTNPLFWIVVVLDRRVLSKNYGRVFIESLPPVSKYQGPLKELPGFAAKWIQMDAGEKLAAIPKAPRSK